MKFLQKVGMGAMDITVDTTVDITGITIITVTMAITITGIMLIIMIGGITISIRVGSIITMIIGIPGIILCMTGIGMALELQQV
jgi:hypothetical protein